jgi:cytochrome c peroxidase
MRKKAAEQKREEFLKKALGKFSDSPNTLTVPDLKALVTAATQSTGSPVKSKKAELQQQLYREPRLSRVQAMSNNLQLTLNNEAAERNNTAAEALLHLLNPGAVDSDAPNLTAV